MAYIWVLLDVSGNELRVTEAFDSKEAAEAWMGAEWSLLRDEGAEYVSLCSGDEQVYKMSLAEG
ncbi:MAG: hypothetical protein ACR2KQ_04085 [Actinomycetota bacterium]